MRGRRQRLLAAFDTERAGDAGQPGAEGEYFDVGSRVGERMRKLYVVVRAALHRAGDVDQQQDLARPGAPLQPSEPEHLAVIADALAQGAAQIGPRATTGAHAAMASASRQSGRGLAREFAQGIAGRAYRKAAFDQCLGPRSDKSGLIGLISQQRFVLAAAFLLPPNHFLLVPP